MKNPVQTDKAPSAIGPYSQGIISGGFLFISGQLPIDPIKGTLIEGSMAAQTEQILHNLTAVAEAAGTGLPNVVKTTIFLKDLGDFAEVNEAYGRFFESDPPARSTVQVAALPLNARIEIEAVVSMM